MSLSTSEENENVINDFCTNKSLVSILHLHEEHSYSMKSAESDNDFDMLSLHNNNTGSKQYWT